MPVTPMNPGNKQAIQAGAQQQPRPGMQRGAMGSVNPINRPMNTGVMSPQRMPQRPMGGPAPMGPGGNAGWNPGMFPARPGPAPIPLGGQSGAGPISNVSPDQMRQNWMTMQRGAVGGLGGVQPTAPPAPTQQQMNPAYLQMQQARAQAALGGGMGAMQSIQPPPAPPMGAQAPGQQDPRIANALAMMQQRRGMM